MSYHAQFETFSKKISSSVLIMVVKLNNGARGNKLINKESIFGVAHDKFG